MDVLVLSIERWIHFLSGVTWIGLLYYFNFVQVPAIAAANADAGGPGPAAINKYVAPRALVWFRWGAVVTWLSGAALLESMPHLSLVDAFTLQGPSQVIGVGAWLGTIMLFNVWVLIWPNQKKVLGSFPRPTRRRTGPVALPCWLRERTRCCRFPCCCSWGRLRTVCRTDRHCGEVFGHPCEFGRVPEGFGRHIPERGTGTAAVAAGRPDDGLVNARMWCAVPPAHGTAGRSPVRSIHAAARHS